MLQALFAIEVPFPCLCRTEVAVACGFLHGRRRCCSSRRVFRVKIALAKENMDGESCQITAKKWTSRRAVALLLKRQFVLKSNIFFVLTNC